MASEEYHWLPAVVEIISSILGKHGNGEGENTAICAIHHRKHSVLRIRRVGKLANYFKLAKLTLFFVFSP